MNVMMYSAAGLIAGAIGGSFTNASGMVIADGIAKVTGLHRETGRLYLQTAASSVAICLVSSNTPFSLSYKYGQLSSSIFWATLLGVRNQELLDKNIPGNNKPKRTFSKLGAIATGSFTAVISNIFLGLPLANIVGALFAYHYNSE